MAFRPTTRVFAHDSSKAVGTVTIPTVLVAPIRQDVVHDVHARMNMNKRQAQGVSKWAGHQHSAESWGTGRAVSRIPRISGGGTGRSGQGAFGNMCRKGRMFAPLKTWRKWHRKISVAQRRYALTSALAASAVPALVMARGHRIETVNEVPLVVSDSVQSITKTKDAIKVLKTLNALEDVAHVKGSKKLRAGKGKLRGRRHTQRRGPLVVYGKDEGLVRAFRNIPGVETSSVEALNLLQLAPGAHLGRFTIWTESAFKRLDALYGSYRRPSQKKNFSLPRPMMANADLTRIINSDEIQKVLRPTFRNRRFNRLKKNPLTNLAALQRLNPAAQTQKRRAVLASIKSAEKVKKPAMKKDALKKLRAQIKSTKKAGKKFYAASVSK